MKTTLTVAVTAKAALGEQVEVSRVLKELNEFNGPELFGAVSKLLYLITADDSQQLRMQLNQDLFSPQVRLRVQEETRLLEGQGASVVCFYRR